MATEAECDEIKRARSTRNRATSSWRSTRSVSPRMDLGKNPDVIADMMFTNEHVEAFSDAPPRRQHAHGRTTRACRPSPARSASASKDGKPVSKNKVYQIRDGLFEAIIDRFYTDPTLVAYGEDVRDWGGAFAVYRGLTEALPYHRLFNAPISESRDRRLRGRLRHGRRPRAGRADVLRLPRLRGRRGVQPDGEVAGHERRRHRRCRWCCACPSGSKYGAQHSQDWTALTAHIPGLKVIFPATPYDAKGLMNSALVGHRPGRVLREPAHLRHGRAVPRGRRARGLL